MNFIQKPWVNESRVFTLVDVWGNNSCGQALQNATWNDPVSNLTEVVEVADQRGPSSEAPIVQNATTSTSECIGVSYIDPSMSETAHVPHVVHPPRETISLSCAVSPAVDLPYGLPCDTVFALPAFQIARGIRPVASNASEDSEESDTSAPQDRTTHEPSAWSRAQGNNWGPSQERNCEHIRSIVLPRADPLVNYWRNCEWIKFTTEESSDEDGADLRKPRH
jgi:hypothetical protein